MKRPTDSLFLEVLTAVLHPVLLRVMNLYGCIAFWKQRPPFGPR